ncbi:hypothetical protein H2198_005484 [Neophaeococcomyces mojaviensis]|uniref:Uncharacterized protein n=1 Tax=Neophaeococcomyces mojaviensis TaxID=3383035 RepID=A0ACC3A5N1_9EURO|nr:hypothetical protein H2198_005484 [Knufia sp. JES_112]
MPPGLVETDHNAASWLSSVNSKRKSHATVSNATAQEDAQPARKRWTIYLLEDFPPQAVQFCKDNFETILPSDPEVRNWRENADAIVVRERVITAEDISATKKLKAIGKQGTGIDIIDLDACDKANIKVLNTPGVNASAVAELTMCLAFAVARQIRTISVKQEQGLEVRKEHCCGLTLTGSCIGVMGMGAIGKMVASMFRDALGCTIYAYDPILPADAWADLPHVRVSSMDEMVPNVDVLSLHVPLLPSTRGCISMAQFRKMKPTAILLNCARGGLVNEKDLVAALREDIIWGAGLDCHEQEPPSLEMYKDLWETGKVVSTPHIGATCASTQVKTAITALERILVYHDSIPTPPYEKA